MSPTLILSLVCALVGWNLMGFDGVIVGAALGGLFGKLLDLQNQVRRMADRIEAIGKQSTTPPGSVPVAARIAPPAAPDSKTDRQVGSARDEVEPGHAPLPRARPLQDSLEADSSQRIGTREGALSAPMRVSRGGWDNEDGWDDEAPAAVPGRPEHTRETDRLEAWLRSMAGRAKAWLTEGNLPVKAGVVIFLFGVAAAIQYVAASGWLNLSMPVRLGGIAAIAVAGLVYGVRSSKHRPSFGVAVQGGAIGVLLLVVFGAFARYHLLSPNMAFACVVAIVATAAVLALRFNAPVLAVLGFLGGFLAPVLISTGSNSPVALFTYVALLDAAVLAIAWRRPWRALNLLAFAGTFVLGLAWGGRYYSPSFFWQVEPFLVAFFLFFAAIPLLYAKASAGMQASDRQVDTTLLFGTPLLAFPLQAALLGDDALGLGLSALVVAGVYGGIAMLARRRPVMAHMVQASTAVGLGFLALAAPLALSGRWTSAAWALQGLAMVFVGLAQNRIITRCAGLLLIAMGSIAGLVHLGDAGWFYQVDRFVFNAYTLDLAVLVLAPLVGAWLHHRAGMAMVARALLALALAWWATWGLREIIVNLQSTLEMGSLAGFTPSAFALFAAITAGICALALRRIEWPAIAWIQALACAVTLAMGLAGMASGGHWFAAPLWLLWPALAIGFATVPTIAKGAERAMAGAHLCLLGLLVVGLGVSLWKVAGLMGLGDGWQAMLAAAVPASLMYLIVHRPRWALWPIQYDNAQRVWFASLAGWTLVGAWIVAQFQPGDADPLPFVPVANPLELAIIAGLFLAWRFRSHMGQIQAQTIGVFLALGGWLALSMGVLRWVHHLADLAWSGHLLASPVAQASLTVAWCVAGVVAWVAGSWRSDRNLWRVGAILLCVVLGKLVLIDRMWLGNMEGIVAFLVVGALLVVVGRLAPSPPKASEAG